MLNRELKSRKLWWHTKFANARFNCKYEPEYFSVSEKLGNTLVRSPVHKPLHGRWIFSWYPSIADILAKDTFRGLSGLVDVIGDF